MKLYIDVAANVIKTTPNKLESFIINPYFRYSIAITILILNILILIVLL